MQFFILLGILLSVRTSILVECSPLLKRLPLLSRLSEISSEDSVNAEELSDDLLTAQLLSPVSPFSSINNVRSLKQSNENIFQDDVDLEDVLREILQDLSRHEKLVTAEEIDTRTRTLIETYDFDTGKGDSYTTNLRSRSYTTKSFIPYPYLDGVYDVDEENVKLVSSTSYRWRILEKTLRRMALDSTKVQIAYNIIREKQVNFHPFSNVYKILEKSVSILHTTRRHFVRPSAIRLPYPLLRKHDRKYFKKKLAKMNRYLRRKLARMNRRI